MSLLKDIAEQPDAPKRPELKPAAEAGFSMIREFNVQAALKTSDGSDAGKYDVVDRASAASDIGFNLMRNTINSSGTVTGSDVADYIERAEELNDEVDTVPFGLETDDGKIVKVYVNAEQADKFEEAMKNMLGLEDDIEEAINRLTTEFDIVDVVWPKNDDEDGDGVPDGDEDLEIDDTSNLELDDPEDEADFADDQYDVIAGGDGPPPEADAGTGKAKTSADEEPAEEEPEEPTDDENSEDEDTDPDDPDGDKPKKKKRKNNKAAPAEPATAAESANPSGPVLNEKQNKQEKDMTIGSRFLERVMEESDLSEAKVTQAKVNAAFKRADAADLAVEREQNRSGYGRSNDKVRELKQKAQRLRSDAKELEREMKSQINEADGEDNDGVKDGFNIPLDSQARAMAAKQKLPWAKRLVAFHFMCGIPGRYMNTSEVSDAIAGAADMLRKKVAVRRAFSTLYEGLANTKGFTIQKDVAEDIEIDEVTYTRAQVNEARAKRGSFIQKLLESVMVELGLPESLIVTTGPAVVGVGIYNTAELIEQDSTLERSLRLLATRMGIRGQDAMEPVDEAKKEPKPPKDKGEPIEVRGVKGMNSKPWSKKFKSQEEMEKWMDKYGDDITVHAYSTDRVFEADERFSKLSALATREIDEAVDVGNDDFAQAVTGLIAALGIPDDILNRRRTQVVQALRQKKAALRNRAQVLTMIGRLMDILKKNEVPEPGANRDASQE